MNNRISLILAAVLATAALAAGEDSLLLKGKSQSNWPWTVNDGGGFRWDIYQNGQVSNGTSSAYSGGLQLYVNDNNFSPSSDGVVSADGREIQVGPWKYNNLTVYRRIYIDPKSGYARWIDIFQNETQQDQDIRVRYYNSMGRSIGRYLTTTGGAKAGEKDWGIATLSGASGASAKYTVVSHFYSAKGSKVRPTLEANTGNSTFYYNFRVKLPAGKAAAVCLFELQRRSEKDAETALKEFNPARELGNLPPALRRIIINVTGIMMSLDTLELPRDDKSDMAVLRGGDELKGTIKNDKYVIETFYGKLELPAAQVIGLVVPAADDPHVQVVLTDGQVVAGKFANSPLTIVMDNGNEMSLPPEKLESASYKVSAERPDELKAGGAACVLRTGQQLYFRQSDAACAFHTEYGDVMLKADQLQTLHMDTPDGGLHRAVFRNGSVLSGLMVPEELTLQLNLGPSLKVKRALLSRLAFAGEQESKDDLATAILRNEDEVYGRLVDDKLVVKTRYGDATIARDDIAQVETVPGALGRVQVKLHNGTTVSGRLAGDKVRFQIEGGPELAIYIGHLTSIACPKPKDKPATAPADSQPTPPEAAAVEPPPTAAVKGAKALKASPKPAAAAAATTPEQEKLRAAIASVDAQAAKVADMVAKLQESGKEDEAKAMAAELEQLRKKQAEMQAMLDAAMKK